MLAARYYEEGADEIAFLNITSFRLGVVEDIPMLHVLEEASKSIFVPSTMGGGMDSYTDPISGQTRSALEVPTRYFRAGADKVRTLRVFVSGRLLESMTNCCGLEISLGSYAVHAAKKFIESGGKKTGETTIETISQA